MHVHLMQTSGRQSIQAFFMQLRKPSALCCNINRPCSRPATHCCQHFKTRVSKQIHTARLLIPGKSYSIEVKCQAQSLVHQSRTPEVQCKLRCRARGDTSSEVSCNATRGSRHDLHSIESHLYSMDESSMEPIPLGHIAINKLGIAT